MKAPGNFKEELSISNVIINEHFPPDWMNHRPVYPAGSMAAGIK